MPATWSFTNFGVVDVTAAAPATVPPAITCLRTSACRHALKIRQCTCPPTVEEELHSTYGRLKRLQQQQQQQHAERAAANHCVVYPSLVHDSAAACSHYSKSLCNKRVPRRERLNDMLHANDSTTCFTLADPAAASSQNEACSGTSRSRRNWWGARPVGHWAPRAKAPASHRQVMHFQKPPQCRQSD